MVSVVPHIYVAHFVFSIDTQVQFCATRFSLKRDTEHAGADSNAALI